MISSVALLGIAVAILCSVVVSVISRMRAKKERDKYLRDIPCEKRHWLLGNAHKYPPNHIGLMNEVEMMRKFPRCIQRWFGPFICNVVGYHPDCSKALLSTNEPKVRRLCDAFRPWLGDGLLLSSGEKWRRNRRLLTPVFHFDSLRRYLSCANEAAMTMMKKWKAGNIQSRSVEMFDDISRMSLDNFLRSMFSDNTGCESGMSDKYLKALHCITEEIIYRLRNPLFYQFDFIYFLSSSGRRYREALDVAHKYTEDVIQKRVREHRVEKKRSSEYDFLDILLMAKDENEKGLSHQEIRDELDTFVFRGHDTVTSALSWAFYNLAVYQDKQEICRKEVLEILDGSSHIEWEHLPKFEYLTKFIKESMRMYPPVVEIARELSGPRSFPDVFVHNQADSGCSSINNVRTFPENSTFSLRIFLLHRNPTVWKNPEVFDPERFDPNNIEDRAPHAYVPFSAGPRNCIGQNFAMNGMKVVLALALSLFKFTVDDTYPEPKMKNSGILRAEEGIHLIVKQL